MGSTRLVVGYGTLLDRASGGSTLRVGVDDRREYIPVLVDGWRRLFNLRPDHYEPSHCTGLPAEEAGAMNVEPRAGDRINAVVFAVSEDELARLDNRERYYERVRVPVRAFGTGEFLGNAEMYAARPDAPWLIREPERLLPRWLDVELGRGGAYGFGEPFGRLFDETTYLADGRTRMVELYRRVVPERMRRDRKG